MHHVGRFILFADGFWNLCESTWS